MCVALFSNVTRFLIANMMAQLIDGGSGGWPGLVAGCWLLLVQYSSAKNRHSPSRAPTN